MDELTRRVEELRADFESFRGYKCAHFFCPILMTDEAAPLSRGHIVNSAIDNGDLWVPQRSDVDNFFGSAVEAGFVAILEDRKKNWRDIFLDQKAMKRHRARIEFALAQDFRIAAGG